MAMEILITVPFLSIVRQCRIYDASSIVLCSNRSKDLYHVHQLYFNIAGDQMFPSFSVLGNVLAAFSNADDAGTEKKVDWHVRNQISYLMVVMGKTRKEAVCPGQ